MKLSIVIAALALCLVSNAEDTLPKKRQLTPEERKARIQLAMMKNNGGLVRDTRNMRGHIAVVNTQTKVKLSDLSSSVKDISETVRFDLKLLEDETIQVSLENMDSIMQKIDANLVVFLVDSNTLPGLLVAPEKRWAIVNVPEYEGKNIKVRVGRELARAIVLVGGGFGDGFSNSLLGPIVEPAQLDGFKSARISFEVAGRMANYSAPLGLEPFSLLTYRETCRLGFAAQPTNDYQRAIWNEIHEKPTNPLKITFDPKTDTK